MGRARFDGLDCGIPSGTYQGGLHLLGRLFIAGNPAYEHGLDRDRMAWVSQCTFQPTTNTGQTHDHYSYQMPYRGHQGSPLPPWPGWRWLGERNLPKKASVKPICQSPLKCSKSIFFQPAILSRYRLQTQPHDVLCCWLVDHAHQ